MEQETKFKEIRNWDRVTISLLIFSIVLIIFSFFTPYLFTRYTSNSNFDFTKTGAIGDTLGGIMNPFIALVGILIIFLAFYMQIKANQIQRKIFNDTLNREKEKEIDNEKKENLARLKIIKALLYSLLEFYKSSGKSLQVFIAKEKDNPLSGNMYSSPTSSAYQNFLKLDLLESYKALVFYFKDKNISWEEDFIKVLDYLHFYDELLKGLKLYYEKQLKDKIDLIHSEGEKLNSIVNTMIVTPVVKDFEVLRSYFEIVRRENSRETDILKLREDFIKPAILKLLEYKNGYDEYIYINLLNSLSLISKKLGNEIFQSESYVENLEDVYNKNFKVNDSKLLKIEMLINSIKI
ncbi:hypothetical protein HYN59_12560 [Flavobacterium album]|uniref:Phage abortive infection protein n=1 Tax=Flavobacterium album TaxID=2175091 RepID=A0A2S1QZU3_9FLAO|nr:hypothetical protein [Flavobacterium album]AWH85885.1 hypothetical protein HYN59_12560 [Flavobacterium album]